MATHASIPAWRIPLTGGWRALVHGVTGVGRDLMTNPPPGGNCEYCYKKVPALPVQQLFEKELGLVVNISCTLNDNHLKKQNEI